MTIRRGLNLIARGQRGVTLIELIVALAVGSLVVGAITIGIFQVFIHPSEQSTKMTAVKQVENAIYWMRRDVVQSQIVDDALDDGESSGFPLILTWVDWNNTKNEVTYSLVNGNLQRWYVTHNASGVETGNHTGVVAEYIDPEKTSCKWEEGVLNLTITADVAGYRSSSETRVVEIDVRTVI